MARNKYPEITENRILDAATKLFWEKGYEQTTIQDIVDALGDLSKGAIYHHFKSKDDIVNAVCDHITAEINPFDKIKNAPGWNGFQKIRQLFLLSLSNKKQREMFHLFPSLLKNPRFLTQTVEECISMAPMLQEIIEEGNADGSLSIAYPQQAAETILLLVNVWINPIVFSVSREEFTLKLRYLADFLDNLGLHIIDEEVWAAAIDFRDSIIPQ
ncbi:TetR/AcrR family transcriptional regulator [Anaeromassilibacillus senegalensis]|uniref:TetR/AcrR family transcriptional regulator n=1 Tax=Anaeromassilibacillus senegalensis TaxID=1673717 RepID=UPI000682B8C9|nr:TetR/AcrR family transcriptional regulator [Anaeromassilibacillus senegalensis]